MSKRGRVDRLQAWAEAVEAEVAKIRVEMAPLQDQLAGAQERLDLIQRLIRLEERRLRGEQGEGEVPPGVATGQGGSTARKSGGGGNVEFHIARILERAGSPMHVRDIRGSLVEEGVPLPGRGDEANVIVRMRRAPERFTRTGRGTYALAAWGLPEAKSGKRKKPRRKTRRSK